MDTIFCIDIGSNSVRAALVSRGEAQYKLSRITKLSEGLSGSGALSDSAMRRTLEAIKEYALMAKDLGIKPCIFGTEAFRRAVNGREFADLIEKSVGTGVKILSPFEEAQAGYSGAVKGLKGGGFTVIDLGGASTEIVKGGENVEDYISLPVGVVVLYDKCGRDKKLLDSFFDSVIKGLKFGLSGKCVLIGGTAQSLAAIDLDLTQYQPQKVNRHILTLKRLKEITQSLFDKSIEQVKQIKSLQPQRAQTISGGAYFLCRLLELMGADEAIISESDNIEGYALLSGNI